MLRRRILSLVLAVLLLTAVLPVFASAEANTQAISGILTQEYKRALRGSGRRSMKGYCGLMTSWQLYIRGINTSLTVCDGKNQYDKYCNMEYTSGGYKVTPYPVSEYSLEEALNAVSHDGTRDVFNILVGFQKTNTDMGRIYGHCLMIYAIVDGIVYFNESFSCSLQRKEGNMITCTIEEFANFYNRWARFEGIVVFGNKGYTQSCQEYATHMFVQTNRQTGLYTDPCFPGTEGSNSQIIRTIISGERLQVTALYENPQGQYFYRVDDGGTMGYILARRAGVLMFDYEDVLLEEAAVPQTLTPGGGFILQGEVHAINTGVTSLSVSVTDWQGQTLMSHSVVKTSGFYDLKDDGFDDRMTFSQLAEGPYIFQVTAETENHYIEDGKILVDESVATVYSDTFWVGQALTASGTEPSVAGIQREDGWFYEDGTWYLYEQGAPRTGWFCQDGVDYYLQPDGSVTTGWATINGKDRLFTATGAMRTGWVETEEGTMYMLSNGVAACGWRTIDKARYCFDDKGIMYHDQWLEVGTDRYYLQTDGSAVTGRVEVDGVLCRFDSAGKLIEDHAA